MRKCFKSFVLLCKHFQIKRLITYIILIFSRRVTLTEIEDEKEWDWPNPGIMDEVMINMKKKIENVETNTEI